VAHFAENRIECSIEVKGKVLPYSLPSVRPGADPGVQAVTVSPQVTFQVILAVGCHYFPPGLWSPFQSKNVTVLWLVPSYTAWWQRHIGVNNLPKVVMLLFSGGNWTHDLLIASPTPYRYAIAPLSTYLRTRVSVISSYWLGRLQDRSGFYRTSTWCWWLRSTSRCTNNWQTFTSPTRASSTQQSRSFSSSQRSLKMTSARELPATAWMKPSVDSGTQRSVRSVTRLMFCCDKWLAQHEIKMK